MKLTIIVFYFTLSLVYCLPNHLRSYIHLMQQQQHSRALRDTVANTTNENNSSSSLFCKAQGCKKEGEQCSGSFSNPEGCHVDCCAYGLECVAVEDGYSICLHNTLNMSCSGNEKLCMRGEQCSINGSCIGIYAPGDSCTSNSDCVLQNNCSSRGVCEGLPENASCTPFSYECDYGFYCSPKTSTCQKQRGSGEGCDSPNACKWLHVCVTGTCRRLWTQQAGSSCIPDDWDYSNCDFGLECLNDSCVHPQRQENVPCIVDSDCPGNEECLCNDFLGGFYCDRPLYTDGCAAEFKSMLQCAENHSCIIEDQSLLPQSCFHRQCKEAIETVSDCFCPEIRSRVGDCIYFEMSGSCSSTSSITTTTTTSATDSTLLTTTTTTATTESMDKGTAFIGLAFAAMFIIVGLVGGAYWAIQERRKYYRIV